MASTFFSPLLPTVFFLLTLLLPQESLAFFGGENNLGNSRQLLAEKNAAEGKAFLKENGSQQGVITTSSGLQYRVVKSAKGLRPKGSDRVTVHYEGRFLDGRVFDSSRKRGKPTTFPLDGVIPGWTEGLQQMSVGSIHTLTIPSSLAYGKKGAGRGLIPPNSTLIFEVELLSIAE
jgi:FKBP-type peptidyl-prolyl cis-trans isomerase